MKKNYNLFHQVFILCIVIRLKAKNAALILIEGLVKTILINETRQQVNTTTLVNAAYLVRYNNQIKRLIIAHLLP